MVNSTEALKLALEALEASTDWDVNATGKQLKSMQAITALRKALAQPEQKPVAKYSDIVSDGGLDPRNKFNIPPQRTWEGLSVFEINDLVESTEYEDYQDLVERTEAKLKEKNT